MEAEENRPTNQNGFFPATFCLPLDSAEATLEAVGGKGSSLARMAASGLPVPPGFHLTTAAYRRFVEHNGLQQAIVEAAARANAGDPASLDLASSTIRALFEGGDLPDDVARALGQAYSDLGEGPVAVRSSATAEDLPGLSFAGQQETYLNVRGDPALLDAVRRCWASLWTARAIGYRLKNGIAPEEVSLAVVVQQLVPADAAGILFTANPLTGARDQVVINAAWGLGEAVVGGQVTPDTLVVERAGEKVLSRETAEKTVMTVRTPTGTVEQPVPEELRRSPVLDDSAALELARLGWRIERLYGMPMDIEWARADGQYAILQARPVTALPESEPEAPAEWKLPNPKGKYARSSIFELLPDPLSPLFATMGLREINAGYGRLGEQMFAAKANSAFPDQMAVLINDYGYYDIGFTPRQLLVMLTRMIPVLVWGMRTAESRWRDGSRPAYGRAVGRWNAEDLAQMPALELLRGAGEILTDAVDHYVSIQAGILPAAYMSEAIFTAFYDRLVRREGDPPAITFVLGYNSLPIKAEKSLYDLAGWSRRQTALARYLAETAPDEIAARLGEAGAPEGIPAGEWDEFARRFGAHLERFGHAIYDLDFAKPVPADDPAPLLSALKQLAEGQGADPYTRQRESAERRYAATREIEWRLRGPMLGWFRQLRRWAQRFAPLREDALGDAGLGWPLLRRMLLELGERLAKEGAVAGREDVFWLTEEELIHLATGLDAGVSPLADHSRAVAERRARLRAAGRLTPPPSLPRKATWAGLDLEKWLPARSGEQTGDTIEGIGASPGRVTATARVLLGPEDFGRMRSGDVLVARITTPAWTPLFALASAVVTDVGGPLSHSSIVAREYGIPAVLGTGAATRRIQDGQTVTVDGGAGTVKLG